MDISPEEEALREYLDSEWVTSYRYYIEEDLLAPARAGKTFHTVWSRPTPERPVAPQVAHVSFVVERDAGVVEFRIENERHVHRPSQQIRFSELVLDRIIARKERLAELLDLRDEFSRNRCVDTLPEDEYAEEERQRKVQAAVRDEVAELEAAVIDMFRAADADGSGFLDAGEFHALLRSVDLGIDDEQVRVVFAMADEDLDGMISYSEFVPTAMELVSSFKTRAALAQREAEAEEEAAEQVSAEMYTAEMQDSFTYLRELLDAAAYVPPSAKAASARKRLQRREFQYALSTPKANLSREEVNLVMASVPTDDEGFVLIDSFETLIIEAKILLTKHSILEHSRATNLVEYLTGLCRAAEISAGSAAEPGRLSLRQLEEMLASSDFLGLSRLQIYSLLADAPAPDDGQPDGLVEWAAFVPKMADTIASFFDPRVQAERAELIMRAEVQPSQLLQGLDRDAVNDHLADLFAQFDQDDNGVLDPDEFQQCLASTRLGLTQSEIAALMLTADVNDDGNVDYEEFLDFAYKVLLHLARERAIRTLRE